MNPIDLATKFESAKKQMWETWETWKLTRDRDDLEVYAFWTERCEDLQKRLIDSISTGEVSPLPMPPIPLEATGQ
jgi:hypothetical protein